MECIFRIRKEGLVQMEEKCEKSERFTSAKVELINTKFFSSQLRSIKAGSFTPLGPTKRINTDVDEPLFGVHHALYFYSIS